jgi:hypothetical protein
MASEETPTEVKKLELIVTLSMNKTQLIEELAKLGLDGGKLTKSELQIALLQQSGLTKDSDDETHASSAPKASSDRPKPSCASSVKSSSNKGDDDAGEISGHSSRSDHGW